MADDQPVRRRRGRPSTTGITTEEVEWLLSFGESLAGVCSALRLSEHGLYVALQRGGRLDLWRRLRPVDHLDGEADPWLR